MLKIHVFPLGISFKNIFQKIKQKYISLPIYSSLFFSLQEAYISIHQNKNWLWTKTKKKERKSKESSTVLCEY